MANAMIGKTSYIYVGGAAVIHLSDWDFSRVAGQIDVDPDIGSTRALSVPGFIRESGNISFNISNDDFATLWDKHGAQASVSMYLYPSGSDTTNKFYMYGNAYLVDLSVTTPLLGTVKGRLTYVSADSTGFNRQARA